MQIQNYILHLFLLIESQLERNIKCFNTKALPKTFGRLQNIRIVNEPCWSDKHKSKSLQYSIIGIMLELICLRQNSSLGLIACLLARLLYSRYPHFIKFRQIQIMSRCFWRRFFELNINTYQVYKMQGSLGGDIIFTSTLDYFPRLSIPYPVFSSLTHFDIPSPECMQSILFKLLIIKGPIQIEQFLQSVALVGKQGTFANKILIIYAISLCIIPLSNTFDRKNEKRPLGQQTNYVMKISINKNERKSCFIKLEIISIGNKKITKDQAIWNGWNKINKQIHKYGMEIIRRQDKNYVGYSQQLQQFGVKLPSTVCLQSSEDIQIIYFNDKLMNGIPIRQYILLMSSNTQRQLYDFDIFLANFAKQLRQCIKKQNSNSRYYYFLSFDNIFICQNKKTRQITIQINIEPTKNHKKLTQNNKKSIYAYQQLIFESNYSKADYWSAGIILLQAIALNCRILRFKRQFESCKTYDEKNVYLSEFIAFIEDQRLIVNPNLIVTIKKWLQLDDSEQVSQAKKQSGDQGLSNQMQRIYAPFENSDFIPPPLSLQKEQLFSGNEINIEQYIWKLQALIFQHQNQINFIIAFNITEASLPEIQQAILLPQFLTFFGYTTITCTLQQDIKCKKCEKKQVLYLNYCGHGQCYTCFTKYLKNKVSKSDQKLITCGYCKRPLSVDILTIILQDNPDLKKLFCNLFIVQYIENIQKKYIYCLNLKCLKTPLIYLKQQSKVLLCQNCKIAYCSACRKTLHYPLDCDQFKQQQNQIVSQAQTLLKEIGLPSFTSNKKTVKLYEQLIGNQHKLISVSSKMVKQWLILDRCANRSNQNNNHISMFKQLSKRVVNILKTIQLFCKGEKLSPQTDDLYALHKARQKILISIFIQ